RLAGANPWIGTTICTGNSPKADHELRLKPDHPMGSGQPRTNQRAHHPKIGGKRVTLSDPI
ncbi:hypothetical protein, partial [Ralstonia mannitolilytica]|uniref:hypothetical protein n=1 Tax=Ralstonia mannitolilytica TaxID=105219 RepID=UPI0029309AAD